MNKLNKILFTVLLMLVSLTCNSKQTGFLDEEIEFKKQELIAVKEWVRNNQCKKSVGNTDKLVDIVYNNSIQKNLDPHLVLGLIKIESCFNSKAKSKHGAIGYTQVIPKWHYNKIKGRSLYNPSVSIDVGTSIIKEYIKLAKGNIRFGLKKYSGNSKNYYEKVLHNMLSIKKHISRHNSRIKISSLNSNIDKNVIMTSINDTEDNNFINVKTQKIVSAVITDFEEPVKQEMIITDDVNSDNFSGVVTYT